MCVAYFAIAAVFALVAYIPLADTPLRTWTRWLPAEVQQDYGTPYALLRLRPLVSWPERAAVVDFDVTETGRAVGLAFLAAGRYFLVNNGPYYQNYDVPIDPERQNWNLFFHTESCCGEGHDIGPSRGRRYMVP